MNPQASPARIPPQVELSTDPFWVSVGGIQSANLIPNFEESANLGGGGGGGGVIIGRFLGRMK